MSQLGQYAYVVIIASVFASVLLSVTPGKGAATAVIRLATGVFLLLIVISPLIRNTGSHFLNIIEDLETDAGQIVEEAQDNRDSKIASVITERAESYILDMASKLGAKVQVEITVQEQIPYLPQNVIISGAVSPLTKQRLSAAIEKDIGLPEESQIWKLA